MEHVRVIPTKLFISEDQREIQDIRRKVVDFGKDVEEIKSLISTVGDGVRIAKSLIKNAGYGLFATRSFRRNQIVTYYDGAVGERIPLTRLDPEYKTHARRINGYYTMYGNFLASTGEKINIKRDLRRLQGSGGGAFMNAKSSEEANCEWYILRAQDDVSQRDETEDPFQIVILFYAKQDISSGSELYVNYGENFWNTDADARSSGTLEKPVFITRQQYYASQEAQKINSQKRVIKRVTPELITKEKMGRCTSCSLSTPFVSVELLSFVCSDACLQNVLQ